MTTLLDAEKDLLAEVKGRIEDLTPEREASIRFKHRSTEARKSKTFEEAEKAPRRFEIEASRRDDVYFVGNAYRAYFYLHTIRIMYPSDPHWRGAASSDIDLIIHDINRYATAVSGVQIRQIDLEQKPEIIADDKDENWIEARLVLRVLYETTGS